MEIVLDASIAAKWFNDKNEDNVEIALKLQEQKILNNLEIIVPDLFYLEIVNVFLTKSRFDFKDVLLIEEALDKMNLKVIYPNHSILKNTITIANDFNLTIYDALYISTAQQYETFLLTEDKKILKCKNKYGFIKPLEEFLEILNLNS